MKILAPWRTWLWVGIAMAVVAAFILWRQISSIENSNKYGAIILLIPDHADAATPEVNIWTDAANERGVLLRPMRISEWMRGASYRDTSNPAPIIVPDSFHRQMSDAAVQTIYRMVDEGASALIVQDGGILNDRGSYAAGSSRFADLVGVPYGNYDRYGEKLSHYDEIHGSPDILEKLGIPPGRYLKAETAAKLTSIGNKDLQDLEQQFSKLIAGYTPETQQFAVLKTDKPTQGTALLKSTEGDLVGNLHTYGKGRVLFINLPITYLMQRTDGIFLHGVLKFFATEIVGQPQLLATPGGRGSLILNWHNDDGAAIGHLETLQKAGIFDHGHQSMHFTAGPDVNFIGDGKGMDLNDNPVAQAMIQKLRSQGHSIGNHGGWIHNYFGKNVNENNADEFIEFLDLNNEAVTRANGGQEPKEYSAPQGSQPLWTYDWFKEHGVNAFYTTSNIGMAPMRVWMGQRRISDGWAFPVMTNGRIASAEDAYFQNMPLEEFGEWLQDLARFIESQGAMRLSYFHPIGAVIYLPAVERYIDTIQECANRGRCQFMSMTEGADFLNRREQTIWSLQRVQSHDEIRASHPTSLATMTWSIPRSRYANVQVSDGKATITPTEKGWQVEAQDGKALTLQLQLQP